MASQEERAFAVLKDDRFHLAEWVHFGHLGPCNDDRPRAECWAFAIGLRVETFCVRWIHATTMESAFDQAAQVLIDGADIKAMPGYAG